MLTIEEIKEIIPHRYPMLLIDRVEELEAGKSIKAKKNVSVNEPFFQGHFPHEPVMPGVLIVEAMAQAGAVAGRYFSIRSRINKGSFFSWLRKRHRVCRWQKSSRSRIDFYDWIDVYVFKNFDRQPWRNCRTNHPCLS